MLQKIKIIIKTFWSGVIFSIAFAIPVLGQQKNNVNKPNIIIFLSDDHGADDMGCTGNKDVSTPVIDQLASEGMLFTHAFAPASVCVPSRSSIYTGLYPYRHGSPQQSGKINKDIKTLPHYLQDQGYRVALAGKVHVGPRESFPFEYMERNNIKDFISSTNQGPFCLIIAYHMPHEPFFNKKDGVTYQNIKPKAWMPDTPETLMMTAAYYDNVENLDYEIGTSLYWLEKVGIPDNTIQIYTSDHGAGLPFGKWSLYEKGLHVPFIIKWENFIKPGTRSDALVSLVDLLPTLLEITSTKIPDNIDGQSFFPVILGKTNKHQEYIFASYTNEGVRDGNRYNKRSIRNDRYKLIINFHDNEPFSIRITTRPDERSVICGYRTMESWRLSAHKDSFAKKRYNDFLIRPKVELYDLLEDPFELKNIADLEHYKEIQQNLLNAIKTWMMEQNDPMVTGI
jgi:N-sulfoglucosamine sulfohydrolase